MALVARQHRWEVEENYVAHHMFMPGEIGFVEKKLHKGVAHTGGFSFWGAMQHDHRYSSAYEAAVNSPATVLRNHLSD